MALVQPSNVQLYSDESGTAGAGGFRITGHAREGSGILRIWLRPTEAWDRYTNPRIDSQLWDVRAYRRDDSAFESIPDFTVADLESLSEGYDFSDGAAKLNELQANGDPIHDRVLAWARGDAGSTAGDVPAPEIREPMTRYPDGKHRPGKAYDDGIVLADSTPAPLGGIEERQPAPVPPGARKSGGSQPSAVTASASAPKTEAKPPTPKAEATPPAPKAEAKPPTPKAEAKPAEPKADAKSATPEVEVKPEAEPKAPSAPPKVPRAATQRLTTLKEEPGEESSLAALRERLNKAKQNHNSGE